MILPPGPPPGHWRYSLRWRNPHTTPPGPRILAYEDVPAGQKCPASVSDKWIAGGPYGICVDFPAPPPIKPWPAERKAATRKRNLERRIDKKAPLFRDELIERELNARPGYFSGTSNR